jgi:hypothetical protein
MRNGNKSAVYDTYPHQKYITSKESRRTDWSHPGCLSYPIWDWTHFLAAPCRTFGVMACKIAVFHTADGQR